jgi:16S rRNA (cytosine967-C5)-methyltransferase
MRYLWINIKTILSTCNGSVPLAHFLKNYCKKHPKLGSRDRKMLSTILYSWYRCEKGIVCGTATESDTEYLLENKVKYCLVVCNALTAQFEKLFADIPALPFQLEFELDKLTSNEPTLSEGISRTEWLGTMLCQPKLFIRVRKNKKQLEALLSTHNLPYETITDNCLALPNGAAIDALLPADWYVVQDASSQATGAYMQPKGGEHWYDCCAGAGGKSLLLMDSGAKIQLTVSDRRASILSNLKERFKTYGLTPPTAIVTDVADAAAVAARLGKEQYDHIICDAPCSGSGTWARTPEQLYFWQAEKVKEYAALQLAIATNASKLLRPGGKLLYITCSVYQEENEGVVNALIAATGMRMQIQTLINGTALKADSMYVAVLQKEQYI